MSSNGYVHNDNIIGDPSSLSDTRLKQNQTTNPSATLSAIFDAFEPDVYDLHPMGADIDGQPLPMERRVGFIADEVKAAIPEDWANTVGSKLVNDVEYLNLDYSSLVKILWATVKALRARVSALEA